MYPLFLGHSSQKKRAFSFMVCSDLEHSHMKVITYLSFRQKIISICFILLILNNIACMKGLMKQY